MPIYEYICKACGAKTEEIQKMSDAPLTKCAACGGKMYRPVSRTSFRLEGGGWYKDLYSSTKPSDKSSATSSESKSESKPESSASSSESNTTSPEKKSESTATTTPATASTKSTSTDK